MAENLAEKLGPKLFLFFGIVDIAVGIFLVYQSLGGLVGNTLIYSVAVLITFLGITFAQYTPTLGGAAKSIGIVILFLIGAYALIKLLSSPDAMRLIGLLIIGKGGMTLIHYYKIEHYMGE